MNSLAATDNGTSLLRLRQARITALSDSSWLSGFGHLRPLLPERLRSAYSVLKEFDYLVLGPQQGIILYTVS